MQRYTCQISIAGRPRRKKRRMKTDSENSTETQEKELINDNKTVPGEKMANGHTESGNDEATDSPLGPYTELEWPLSSTEEVEYLKTFNGVSDIQKWTFYKFFKSADSQKRGFLSVSDFRHALIARGFRGSTCQIAKMYSDLNTNSNLELTVYEFMTEICKRDPRLQTESDWRALFEMSDKNKDGFIDIEDFEKTCKELNVNMLRAHMVSMIKRTDKDKDGVVSYKEFLECY